MLGPVQLKGVHAVCKPPPTPPLGSPFSSIAAKHSAQPCPARVRAHEQQRPAAPPAPAIFTPVASSSSSSRSETAAEAAPTHPAPLPELPHSKAAAAKPPSAKRSAPAPNRSGPNRPHTPRTPAELHDEQLYEEIRGCDAWQDVLEVVVDEGTDMSTKRVVQALGRFNTLLKAARLPPAARAQATSRPELQHLLQLLYPKLPSLKLSQASSVVVNLAQLEVRPSDEHMLALLTVLGQHASDFSARDIASVVHSLVALGVDALASQPSRGSLSPSASAKACRTLLDSLSTKACSILSAQLPQPQQEAEAPAPAPAASPSDAPSTPEPEPSGPAPAAPGAAPHVQATAADAFTPQGICMLLNSAARLQYRNSRLLTAATNVVVVQISDFTPQGVSNVLWATATLERYFPALVDACLTYCSRHRTAFKPKEASNVMWALCKLRHHPQQHSQLLTQALLSPRPGEEELKPADLVALLQLLSTFCIFPGKAVMGQLCKRLQALLPQCSAPELCECLRALGLLGETKRPVFSEIAALLPPLYEAGELDSPLLRQVFQSLLCATLAEDAAAEAAAPSPAPASPPSPSPQTRGPEAPASSSFPVPSFPPPMMEKMKRLWTSMIQLGVSRATRDVSPTKVVSEIISGLRVRHDCARSTKDGLVLIDIALRPTPDRYVALQVLRGFDHTCNTDQLLGSVQLERQILEKNGWEVKYLLYQDLLQVPQGAQLFFIAEYLRNIGCRLPAVAAPGARGGGAAGTPSSAAAAARASRPVVSEAAREANLLLREPNNKGQRPPRRA